MITLVAARDRNGAIGRDNQIPWQIAADLHLFQRETLGGAIIMGRRTWDSLPVRPLQRRLNIVVSGTAGIADHVAPSVQGAIALARAQGHMRIYGIGGQRIYRDMLPIADRLLITEVDLRVADADTFFPDMDEAEWRQIAQHRLDDISVARELIRR